MSFTSKENKLNFLFSLSSKIKSFYLKYRVVYLDVNQMISILFFSTDLQKFSISLGIQYFQQDLFILCVCESAI